MYENIIFDKKSFENECNNKLRAIDYNLKEIKNEELRTKIEKVLNGSWMKNYKNALYRYYEQIGSEERYNNNFIQYIENVRNNYKTAKKKLDDAFSKSKKEAMKQMKSEDDKQKFEKNVDEVENNFSKSSEIFKKTLKKLKDFGGINNAYLINTLIHNLSYCKNDVFSTKKIGFLDYLLYISQGNQPDESLSKKLRDPFLAGSSLDVNKLDSEIDKFSKKLNSGSIVDYDVDFQYISKQCNCIVEGFFDEMESNMKQKEKELSENKNQEKFDNGVNKIIEITAKNIKTELTNLVSSECPEKELQQRIVDSVCAQGITSFILCCVNRSGTLPEFFGNRKLYKMSWYDWMMVGGSIASFLPLVSVMGVMCLMVGTGAKLYKEDTKVKTAMGNIKKFAERRY